MKKSLTQFLTDSNFTEPKTWSVKFDIYKSLNLALAVLIYCAQNGLKVSYAGLARLAQVDEKYQRGQAMGIVVGEILRQIGNYCKYFDQNMPKLTCLCVQYITGYAGDGFKEFEPGYDKKSYAQKKYFLLKEFAKLKQFNFNKMLKSNNITISNELINSDDLLEQNLFWEPKNIKDLDDKVAELEVQLQDNPDKIDDVKISAQEVERKLTKEDKRYIQDTNLKRQQACFVNCFISLWSAAVLLTLWGDYLFLDSHISQEIYITMFGTTLATVIGLQLIVTVHFFPKSKH